MTQTNSKKIVTRSVYIGISLLFLAILIGTEFFWRYDQHLNLTIKVAMRDNSMAYRTLVIFEKSDSPIDTARREFKDIRHGSTDIMMWLEGNHDTIHLSLQGKYLSEGRSVHISSDSSNQIILIPNTIQGLPTGSNKIIYLKNDSAIALKEFTGFINDIDKDGREEINIPEKGGWVRLNTQTGEWIPAQLKTTP